jgi:hypothetical protein
LNLVEKYKEQLSIVETAQTQALNTGNIAEVREIALLIYQLCNAISIEEGGELKQYQSLGLGEAQLTSQ